VHVGQYPGPVALVGRPPQLICVPAADQHMASISQFKLYKPIRRRCLPLLCCLFGNKQLRGIDNTTKHFVCA